MLSDVDELEVHLESTSFCTDEFPQITDPNSLTDLIGKIAKLTSQYVKIAITNAFCIDEGSVSTPPTEIKFVWEPDSFDSEGNKENGSKNLIANKDASNTEGEEMDDEEYHQIDEEEVAQVVYEKVIVLRKIIDLLMAQKDSAGKEQ